MPVCMAVAVVWGSPSVDFTTAKRSLIVADKTTREGVKSPSPLAEKCCVGACVDFSFSHY